MTDTLLLWPKWACSNGPCPRRPSRRSCRRPRIRPPRCPWLCCYAATAWPAAIRRTLPPGYAVLDARQGDLNRDALPDWVVVLHKADGQKTSDVIDHPTKRPLLLFVGGAFTLAARTGNAVYCVDCGGMMGDPFTGLVIKKGYFTVEHYGGSAQRWTRYVAFRYDAATRSWLLHRDGSERFHALAPRVWHHHGQGLWPGAAAEVRRL